MRITAPLINCTTPSGTAGRIAIRRAGDALKSINTKGGPEETGDINMIGAQHELARMQSGQPRQALVYLRNDWRGNPSPEPDGVSLDEQRELCRRAVSGFGAVIVREYVEELPIRGDGNRPELRKVLMHAADPDVDYLIVYSVSRLMHGAESGYEIAWRLGRTSTAIVIADEHLEP